MRIKPIGEWSLVSLALTGAFIGAAIIAIMIYFIPPPNQDVISLRVGEWECTKSHTETTSSMSIMGGKVPITTFSTHDVCTEYRKK